MYKETIKQARDHQLVKANKMFNFTSKCSLRDLKFKIRKKRKAKHKKPNYTTIQMELCGICVHINYLNIFVISFY